jgi:class 3 adenylate cyclase
MPLRGPDRDRLGEAISARVEEQLLRSFGGRSPLPEGVITILFTDVEGSSQLVQSLGDDQARAVLRRHDEAVRSAIQAHEGIEVERAGDSFMAAFRLPRHAIACAIEIQRSFHDANEDDRVRVRIGMDTGEVIAEEQGYFGQTVFRASRIADLAQGGKILVSEATRVLAAPAGFAFEDLGELELRGLGKGHRIFEVVPNDQQDPVR